MSNVLITGASGFIGKALCKKMLAEGWQVRGTIRNSKDFKKLPLGIDVALVESIGLYTDWTKPLNGVDTVVHLAARVHMTRDSVPNSLCKFRHVNVNVTAHLARMAAAIGCRRFIFMSSIKVNGEERNTPYNEDDITAPLESYGISKWEAEQVLHEIAEGTGMEIVILRPPLVYGLGVKANFLRLLETVARGIPLPLANVNNRRSLIYIENLVDAVVTCISHPQAAGQTYLVSDGEDVSTSELIRRVGSALDRPARMFPFPIFLIRLAGKFLGKSAEVERLIGSLMVDCSRIKRELDWTPPYTMAQGLRETAKWYKIRGKKDT